jgi:HNH endonuclease
MSQAVWVEKFGRKYRLQGEFYITEDEKYIVYKDHQYKWDGFYYKRYHYAKKIPSNLHRAVWTAHFGAISPNCHVHHRDGNPRNNEVENLQCLPAAVHLSYAAKKSKWVGSSGNKQQLIRAQEKAKLWHASEEGHEWHVQHGKKAWKNRKPISKKCLECGKEYEAWFPWSKYCHYNCKGKARRKSGIDNENRQCEICNKWFVIYKHALKRTCGQICATKLARITKGL